MDVNDFREQVIKKCLSDNEGDKVFLRPNFSVCINKQQAEKIKDKFIECMKKIPDIEKGLSYIKMAGCPEFWLEQRDALICQAIGKVLGLWEIFPGEQLPELYEDDPIGMFPMNTGLTET